MHSDLNPKNLLVDPDTLEVTGLLDWEFAHAGLPVTDLGNLLRFDRDPAFAERGPGGLRATAVPDAAGRPAGPGPGGRPVSPWSTWPPGAARTRSPSGPTTCSAAIAPSGDLHAVPR